MEAKKIDNRVRTDDDLVVAQAKPGTPIYNMPAADRYCKAHGMQMSDMSEKDWERYIVGYTK